MTNIPYGRHFIDQDDIDTVVAALKSGWLTNGAFVNEFENSLKKVTGAALAIACSSGTSALHLAVLALGIGEGDVVIVPAITFLATANAVRFVGADVIFADVNPATGLMTPENLEQAIQAYTGKGTLKALINVHFAGQCDDLENIHRVAKAHGLKIIDDAAHAIGTKHRQKNGVTTAIGANTFCDLTVFSFHPVKTIATGEGGAVTTHDPELAKRMYTLRAHGMLREANDWQEKAAGCDTQGLPNPWYYEMQEIGFNYRISDLHCALGVSQLKKLDTFIEQRQNLVSFYDEAFLDHLHIKSLEKTSFATPAWHLYVVRIDFEQLHINRADLMRALREKGIGTQVHYIPLYQQPYYRQLYGALSLPGSQAYYASCLSIPLFVGLDNPAFIVDSLQELLK